MFNKRKDLKSLSDQRLSASICGGICLSPVPPCLRGWAWRQLLVDHSLAQPNAFLVLLTGAITFVASATARICPSRAAS